MSILVNIGQGYVADALSRLMIAEGWTVRGTARSLTAPQTRSDGVRMLPWPRDATAALDGITHLLISAPPGQDGDPVLAAAAGAIAAAPRLQWIGYLSTVGVYGDHQGGWVNETTPVNPSSARGRRRVSAETAWLSLGAGNDLPVQVFRLPGIYGPGRSVIDRLRDGRARAIDRPGQVFNRIHVDDIAAVLRASMARPDPGRIYNVTDDLPAPPQDVVIHAAGLMGLPPPPVEPFDTAALSEMGRSFFGESKRVANHRIKEELGITLRFPTYREGLRAILAGG